MTTDVLYLAFNRLAYTKVTFGLLCENTDWTLVDRLVVYDDGSTEKGARKWLEQAVKESPADRVVFRRTSFRSPVHVMQHYLSTSSADVFAKVDNDIAVPPGWLTIGLDVLRRHTRLELLGIAAGWTGFPPTKGMLPEEYGYEKSSHIGGVGLMRTRAFGRHPDLGGEGRFGFTEYQHRHVDIPRGWVTPDMPVVQLDLIPDEPWASLAEYYVGKKWARAWPPYAPESASWWDWITLPVAA